jgi:hypothetical protein
MVLDTPSKDHWPALAKRFPPMGHVDPPYSLNYPVDYPDSPRSKWLYSAFQKAHEEAMEEYDHTPPCIPSPMTLDPPSLQDPDSPMSEWLHKWEPYVNTQTHTPTVTGSRPRLPMEEVPEQPYKCRNLGDSKDPEHPCYQYGYREAYRQYVCNTSKDRTNLEALEDNYPAIPRNVPPEDLSLDDTAREDTMREDAPLATSHDPSLPPPNTAGGHP